MERDRTAGLQPDFRPSFSPADRDGDHPSGCDRPTSSLASNRWPQPDDPCIQAESQPDATAETPICVPVPALTETHKPVPHSEWRTVEPLATAAWYGEQVAPRLLPSNPQLSLQRVSLPEPDTVEKCSAIQIYPPPAADGSSTQKFTGTSREILAKIRAPYDVQDKLLSKLMSRLRQPVATESDPAEEIQAAQAPVEKTLYLTPFGSLSFEALHERTRKYAAFVFQHTHQVSPADIEDGLQAGYTVLWQRLQREPDLLQGKQMAWIGKGIVYKGLHAIRGDWTYQKHIQAEEGRSSTDNRGRHSWESRQADMRADIQQAIAEVAQQIMTTGKGKRADHDLWALYGLTMLKVSSSELSRLFGVREQSMQAAYKRVRERLQTALPHYAPVGETKPVQQHGREKLPQQDLKSIQQANKDISDDLYTVIQTRIEELNADTRRIDEFALEGIRQGVPISTQARTHHLPQYQMQRAYKRVHLMIGAERDGMVRMLRPERRTKSVFTLTPASAAEVEELANALLAQPKSYEKLVALHAHISNLAISTTAKHFNIPTSTLRYYAKQIGMHLGTPTRPAREVNQAAGD